VAFSGGSDTKHLASITNKNSQGEAVLAFWNPERMKCEAQVRIAGK
jgi:PP-loop superfamily ATP-utilizing enzyme